MYGFLSGSEITLPQMPATPVLVGLRFRSARTATRQGSFDEKEIKVRYALGVGRNDLKPPRSTRLFCRQV